MELYARALLLAGWLGVLCGLGTAGHAAALIRTQGPCAGAAGYCLSFNPGTPMPLTIRTFQFYAPGAGAAWVTFQGQLVCSSFAPDNQKGVSLYSQIVAPSTAPPVYGGDGGLTHFISLQPSQHGTTDSVNLASTRAFYIGGAGTRTFALKINAGQMDGTTVCYVYDATFTVVFAPA